MEQLEFVLATDEASLWPAPPHVEHAEHAPGPALLPGADLDCARVLDVDRADGQPPRNRAESDRAGRGRLLEPRRHIHGLAGGERRIDVVHHELARFDPGAGLEPELVHRVEHVEGRANGPLRVILVRLRYAEGRHDGVSRELLDRSAVEADALRGALEVPRHLPAHDLGVAAREQRRRVDEIDEQDRRKLALHDGIVGSGPRLPRAAQSGGTRLALRPGNALEFEVMSARLAIPVLDAKFARPRQG